MAFDEGVAQRVREALGPRRGITEKRMFGGLAFMSRGYMFVGVLGGTLMARVGPDGHRQALKQPHAREMDFTGRPMKGYVYVDPPGFESDRDLGRWVTTCLAFVDSLPARPPK